MGRQAKKLALTEEEWHELKRDYEAGKSHAYRKRCQMMLPEKRGKKFPRGG
jgi:hypothetical protein